MSMVLCRSPDELLVQRVANQAFHPNNDRLFGRSTHHDAAHHAFRHASGTFRAFVQHGLDPRDLTPRFAGPRRVFEFPGGLPKSQVQALAGSFIQHRGELIVGFLPNFRDS